MRIGNKKYRLKKSVKRVLYSVVGITMGLVCTFNTNARAADTHIKIDDDRISIEDYEYFKEKSVVKVTLSDSVQQIGFSSFEGCTELSSINLVDGLCVIDNRAFAKCRSLKKIDIPESTVFIGNAAFYDCENLENIVIPAGIRELSNNMFYGCLSLSDISISEGVTSLGQQIFYNCKSLESIELPKSLTKIEDGAFYDCSSLGAIEIPESVTSIGKDAFEGCDKLIIVAKEGSCAQIYADENGIPCNSGEEAQVVAVSTKIVTPDVPATGVETHYLMMTILMVISGMGLFGLNRRDRIVKISNVTATS